MENNKNFYVIVSIFEDIDGNLWTILEQKLKFYGKFIINLQNSQKTFKSPTEKINKKLSVNLQCNMIDAAANYKKSCRKNFIHDMKKCSDWVGKKLLNEN